MAVFGTTGSGGTSNFQTQGLWLGSSGVTTTGGQIDSLQCFFNGGDVPVRLAIYTGGAAGSLDGATLLHDQPYTVPASTFGSPTVTLSSAVTLPAETRIHFVLIASSTLGLFTRADDTLPEFSLSDFDSAYTIDAPPSFSDTAAPASISTISETAKVYPFRFKINYTVPGVSAAPVAFKTVKQAAGTNVGVKVYKGALRDSAEVVLPYELRVIDANGNLPAIDLSATTVAVGDNIFVRVQSEGGADSFTREMLAEDIA